jgi:hypothetical protein
MPEGGMIEHPDDDQLADAAARVQMDGHAGGPLTVHAVAELAGIMREDRSLPARYNGMLWGCYVRFRPAPVPVRERSGPARAPGPVGSLS